MSIIPFAYSGSGPFVLWGPTGAYDPQILSVSGVDDYPFIDGISFNVASGPITASLVVYDTVDNVAIKTFGVWTLGAGSFEHVFHEPVLAQIAGDVVLAIVLSGPSLPIDIAGDVIVNGYAAHYPSTTTWFVDSVNGSNAYDGRTEDTPLKTIAAVLAKPIADGDGVSLARGSHWRETLSVPVDNFRLDTFGRLSDPPPILDGSDIIASGWVRHDPGTYPDVWSQVLVPDGPVTTASERTMLFENGTMLPYQSSIANVQANGGWTSSDRAGLSQTVYFKSVADPNTSGAVYEFTIRNYAVNGHESTLGVTRRATLSGPFELRNCRGHYNALSGGVGSQRRFYIANGSIHHLVTEADLLEDVCVSGFDVSQATQVPHTAYTDAGAGRSHVSRRIFVIGDPAVSPVTSWPQSVYGHSSASGWDALTYSQCGVRYSINAYSASFTNPQLFTVQDSVALDCVVACQSSQAPLQVIERTSGRRQTGALAGNSGLYVDSGPVDTDPRDRVIRDCVWSQSTDARAAQGVLLGGRSGTLLLENCLFFLPTAVNTHGLLFTVNASGHLDVIVRNCIFVMGASRPAIRFGLFAGATFSYVGENNLFVFPGSSTAWAYDNGAGTGSSTTTTSFATWQAQSGGDSTSLVASGAASVGWLGDPYAGDFRLDPSGLAGLRGCGPREHWDFNERRVVSGAQSRWPTLPETPAEMRVYVANPEAWDFYP